AGLLQFPPAGPVRDLRRGQGEAECRRGQRADARADGAGGAEGSGRLPRGRRARRRGARPLLLRRRLRERGRGLLDGGTAVGARREETFETQALFRMWLKAEGGGWKITKQELIRGTTVTGDRTGFTDLWGRKSFDSQRDDGAQSSAGVDFVSHRNPLFSTPA